MALLLHRALPRLPPVEHLSYRGALGSVLELDRRRAVLRQRMMLGALQMAGFTMLWTAVAFLLGPRRTTTAKRSSACSGSPASPARSSPRSPAAWPTAVAAGCALTAFLTAILASWALLAAGVSSLIALIAGIVLLDLGVQGAQISNQSTIYALRPRRAAA